MIHEFYYCCIEPIGIPASTVVKGWQTVSLKADSFTRFLNTIATHLPKPRRRLWMDFFTVLEA